MSLLRGLPLLLAGIAIGCDARALDSHDAAGGGSGGVAGLDAGRDQRIDVTIEVVVFPSQCANRIIDPGEQCDDGNKVFGDGCSPICQIECYASCGMCGTAGPCTVEHACGDGVVDPGEACDDSNTGPLDGCAANCATIEPGWRCPAAGYRCVPICGDGMTVGPETCDDGGTVAGDGCSDNCILEPVLSRCGDGVIDGAEECDNGPYNRDQGPSACTTRCKLPYCGDGIKHDWEDCDDGALQNNGTYGNRQGCAAGCVFPHYCGDAILDAESGEQCDLGPNNGRWDLGPVCSAECKIPLI